jgi:3D (Asp-Asp-Asp) domain-containing protein
MKHKTKRGIAAVLTTVMAADLLVMPLCSKPLNAAHKAVQKVVTAPKPIKTIPPTHPIKPQVAPVKKLQPIKRTFRVTAYTAIDEGQDGQGITASGKRAMPYITVAASKEYPFGTILVDAATQQRYIVEDRGGAIKGNRLDLYLGQSNVMEAQKYGVKYREFYVYKPQ